MVNNISEVKDRYKQIYPAFGSYTECMSRSLLTGLSSTIFSFSAAYFLQSFGKKHLPYGLKGNILISSFLAAAVGYKVTADRSCACQAAWMAAEEKHTYLTEPNTPQTNNN